MRESVVPALHRSFEFVFVGGERKFGVTVTSPSPYPRIRAGITLAVLTIIGPVTAIFVLGFTGHPEWRGTL